MYVCSGFVGNNLNVENEEMTYVTYNHFQHSCQLGTYRIIKWLP